MYLGIDIGGTKTLVARLSDQGVIEESYKFPTPSLYRDLLKELAKIVVKMSTKDFRAVGVAIPGKVNRDKGVGHAFGRLTWRDVPVQHDIKAIVNSPVVIDNDANLAGLSEAMLIPQYERVLYVTVSTGIGTGIITNQEIDPEFADSEGGEIMLEYKGKLQKWEDFASGKAIVSRFGKKASEITDPKIWEIIANDLSVGFFDLIAFMQPNAIVIGGGVGTYLDRFKKPLLEALKKLETPITPIPPIYRAQRPEEAVIYGCYDLAKKVYGRPGR
jgi:glucokinase